MNRKRTSVSGKKVRALILTGIVTWAIAGCDSAAGPQMSKVQILLTDQPTDMLASAEVWISHVYLQGGADAAPAAAAPEDPSATSGRVDLYNDAENPLSFDLLMLQGGVTANVTDLVDIPADTYQGLRFVVDSARVTLADGYAFEDGTNSAVLMVPSGSESGIKVDLADVIAANEGAATTLTVDFNVDTNFVVQQNAQSGAVTNVLFTPVLTEKARENSDS